MKRLWWSFISVGSESANALDCKSSTFGYSGLDTHPADQADEVDWQSTRSEPLYHNLPVSHTIMGCQMQWLATCNAWPFSSARLDGRKLSVMVVDGLCVGERLMYN